MPRDAGGNGNPTTFAGTALSWDNENRLTAHGTALDAAYRGDGLRAWQEGASRTYFLYDGINVVCELDADGDLLASSTFGAAGLLSRGSVQYQFDPLGDAVHLLDGDGAVIANRLFDAWGNELTTGPFNPRGYRARYGYYTDEETGLIALAYRYYAPGVGRFLNRDPIGYEGGVSLISYCENNPLTRTDVTGLMRFPALHGRYCGPNVSPETRPPVTNLDACCKAHDACFQANGCNLLNQWMKRRCLDCNLELCTCIGNQGWRLCMRLDGSTSVFGTTCQFVKCVVAGPIAQAYGCSGPTQLQPGPATGEGIYSRFPAGYAQWW